jgi:hypothetical protein
VITLRANEEKDHPCFLPFGLILVEYGTRKPRSEPAPDMRRQTQRRTLRGHSAGMGYWSGPVGTNAMLD